MGSRRTRLGIGIVVGVLLACLAAALLGVALAKPDPDGYGPDAERNVVGFCTRSVPDVSLLPAATPASTSPATATSVPPGAGPVIDDPDDTSAACRCAYQHLAATVPWARFVAIDKALRSTADPPPELLDAVRACGASPAS